MKTKRWSEEENKVLTETMCELPFEKNKVFLIVSEKTGRSIQAVRHHWNGVLQNPNSRHYVGITPIAIARDTIFDKMPYIEKKPKKRFKTLDLILNYFKRLKLIILLLMLTGITTSCSDVKGKYAYIAYYDAVECLLDDCCRIYDFMDTTAEGDAYADYCDAKWILDAYYFISTPEEQEDILKSYYRTSEKLIAQVMKDCSSKEKNTIIHTNNYASYKKLKKYIK